MPVFLAQIQVLLTFLGGVLTDTTTADTITGLDFDIFQWLSDGLISFGNLFTVFPYNVIFWFGMVAAIIGIGIGLIKRRR